MDRVVGVMKAYSTRVGDGALPTEDAQLAQMFHNLGREFGATTGRKRRCGWFDAVATRYAGMINGIDEVAITNLDGLDQVDPIRICVGYQLHGKRLDVPPCDATQLANCEPVYEEVAGWNTSIKSCTEILAASFGCEKICEIPFRTGRWQTLHGERWSRARRNDRVVKS